MYQDHVPQISAAMRDNPEAFIRGCLFAIVSIRMPITRVPRMLGEIDREGEFAPALFGHKHDAYQYLMNYGSRLWETCRSAPTRDVMGALVQVPGLGIVKSGFIAQMLGHDIGCLDSRNEWRLGLKPRRFDSNGFKGKATKAFQRKLDAYMGETLGRAQELWDDWCTDAGLTYDMTAQEISAIHLEVCR